MTAACSAACEAKTLEKLPQVRCTMYPNSRVRKQTGNQGVNEDRMFGYGNMSYESIILEKDERIGELKELIRLMDIMIARLEGKGERNKARKLE